MKLRRALKSGLFEIAVCIKIRLTCSVVKSSRLMVVLLPSRVSSFPFHLDSPLEQTDPAAVSARSPLGYDLKSSKFNALVTQPKREYPLAVGAIRIEGVSHENAHTQN